MSKQLDVIKQKSNMAYRVMLALSHRSSYNVVNRLSRTGRAENLRSLARGSNTVHKMLSDDWVWLKSAGVVDVEDHSNGGVILSANYDGIERINRIVSELIGGYKSDQTRQSEYVPQGLRRVV